MIQYRKDLWTLLEDIPGDLAELGVAEGNYSAEMLSWPINRKVYMVDRWETKEGQAGDGSSPQEWHDTNKAAALERVKPYGDRAIPLQGDSVAMADRVPDGSLALVYIDCDHSQAGVDRDIRAWLQKLVPGGIMAFHDYMAPEYGVRQAVDSYFHLRGIEIHNIPENRPEDASALIYWPGGAA